MTSTAASNSEIVRLSGSVSPYKRGDHAGRRSRPSAGARARPRRRCCPGRARPAGATGRRLAARRALDPVRGEQHDHRPADADEELVGRRSCWRAASGANSSGSLPALEVNTKSTAYSGSTAISASRARASPAEMSSWMTSAPQPSRNAAPTTAEAVTEGREPVGSGVRRMRRMRTPGRVTRPAATSARPGWRGRGWSLTARMLGVRRCSGPGSWRGSQVLRNQARPGLPPPGLASPSVSLLRCRGRQADQGGVGSAPGKPGWVTTNWREWGRCKGADPEIFYPPEDDEGPPRPRRRSARPARCGRSASSTRSCREKIGVWGGTRPRRTPPHAPSAPQGRRSPSCRESRVDRVAPGSLGGWISTSPPELAELQATVRKLAQEQGRAARPRDRHARQRYPQDLFDLFRDTGLLGLVIPEEYGGGGRRDPRAHARDRRGRRSTRTPRR